MMQKLTLILIALCFIFLATPETFGQTRKPAKKPVKRKLVKCSVNGKIVYRTKCPALRIKSPTVEIEEAPTLVLKTDQKTDPATVENPYGGLGTGQGTGDGLGAGRGRREGDGNGVGDSNGDGVVDADDLKTDPKTKQKPKGPTTELRILTKPRPSYTDAARQNNVQGTVILRITFLAGGQLGSISVVKGLPYGLTEQAIAAARNIRFEPAKRNGVPYDVTRLLQFTFNIY